MKVSKRIQYGLEFLLNLGLRWPEYSTVLEIAERNNLPHKYLEAVASDLRKAGLVDVKRGAGGGYRLLISMKKIVLLDVFTALDSDWNEPPVNQNSFRTEGEKAVSCFLTESVHKIHETASQITLESLVKTYHNNSELLYHI